MSDKVVVPQLGYWFYILIFGAAVSVPIGLYMLFGVSARLMVFDRLIGFFLIFAPLLLVITLQRIGGTRISRSGCKVGGPTWLPGVIGFEWDNVKAITDDGSSVTIHFRSPVKGRTWTVVIADWIINSDELKKAMLEAAVRANPDVERTFIKIQNRYGPPPYGIFE